MQKGTVAGKMVMVVAAALLLAVPVMAGNGKGAGAGQGNGDQLRPRDGSCRDLIEQQGPQQLAGQGDWLRLFLKDRQKDWDRLKDGSCLG